MTTPRKPGEQDKGDNPDQQSEGPATGPGRQPPWQRGQQNRAPQNSGPHNSTQQPAGTGGGTEPSTGPARPERNGAPAQRPPSGRPVVTGTAAPKPPATPPRATPRPPAKSGRPVVTGTAAPQPVPQSATKPAPERAAQSKAAAIDEPTRNIARTDLAQDMPDLSSVSHPAPAAPAAVGASGAVRRATSVTVGEDVGTGLRATVQVRRFDPWSTLKVSLVISVALFFVWMVAVGLLYVVLDGMGVWDRLNNAFTEIISDSGSGGLVTSGQVFGYSALVGLMNVVLFTALATIGSFIYNLCSDLVGGIQVTLADPD